MATSYSINITMDESTVDFLTNNGYSLYAFKAVKGPGDGRPVVWFQTTEFAQNTSVSWEVDYAAYTSKSQIIPNGQITASNSYPINLNQQLHVTQTTGGGEVVPGNTPDAVEFLNGSGSHMTCGLSQKVKGQYASMCAFPLAGSDMDIIAPIQKIVLMFASRQLNTGVVVEQAFGPAVVITYTGTTDLTIGYEQDKGWQGEGWAEELTAGTRLVPFLIVSN